jgi:uncharacterized protein YdhG (YjbR/CyaY superfamily)
MTAKEIDDYLSTVPEPKRATLEALRRSILAVIPEAEQCISYAMPAFRVNGKVLAGFAEFKNHLAYLPHSGQVLREIPELASYEQTTGSLHFAIDTPLPDEFVAKLIAVRRAPVFGD